MSTRKNIDNLYLRMFEGAEVAPPKDAWQNIASRLPEGKKKKKMIPIWFRFAGTAALLLLLLNLGRILFPSGSTNSHVYNTSVTRKDIHKEIQLSSAKFTETMLQVSIRLQEIIHRKNYSDSEINAARGENSSSAMGSSARPSESIAIRDKKGMPSEFNEPVASGAILPDERSSLLTGTAGNVSPKVVVKSDMKSVPVAGEEFSLEGAEDKLTGGVPAENAIAQQVTEEFAKTKEETGESVGGKLSISTRVAPVFYENTGNGNAMGISSVDGETSGEVSVSYGINLAYRVSDRIKIRSGVNKLDLSFSTPGVPMAAAMNLKPVLGKSDPYLMALPVEGDLQQQMDFIEVPVEVEYRLLDRRIGLNLISGGSTLFLNSNKLNMHSGMRNTDLGQAENMDEVNFSANMGLGIDYQLAPKFRLSLEPMVKYQLNSFSEDSGMRPYYMAIYSGFSFSF